jgi:hypothetical protein
MDGRGGQAHAVHVVCALFEVDAYNRFRSSLRELVADGEPDELVQYMILKRSGVVEDFCWNGKPEFCKLRRALC